MDWTNVIEHAAPTIASIAALVVALRTHKTVNSRMDDMKELIEREAYARGQFDQRQEDASKKSGPDLTED